MIEARCASIGIFAAHICLIKEGEPHLTTEADIEGYPIKLPMIDINTIGAGGGSIAWVDAGGALRVGPQSAGADPGPVCYGRGGREPTVTDANAVLGRLNPSHILGGEMPLDIDRAGEILQHRIATLLKSTARDPSPSTRATMRPTSASAARSSAPSLLLPTAR